MPDSDQESITKLNPQALQISSHDIKSINRLLQTNECLPIIQPKRIKNHEEKLLLPKIPQNPLISITQILEGCLSSCSFCKTKLAKGNVFSYSQDKILKSIENDLQKGAKEVYVAATHAILSGDAVEKLNKCAAKEIIVTDTVPMPKNKKISKFKVMSLAELMAQVIQRIHDHESLGELFSWEEKVNVRHK